MLSLSALKLLKSVRELMNKEENIVEQRDWKLMFANLPFICKLKFHISKKKTVIRNLLFRILLYFKVFRSLQCHTFKNLKIIYVLSEKFHQSSFSGYQNHTVLSSPILDVFTFGHVS